MSTLSFSFNTSLISESLRDEFVKKFFSLSLEYQELTSSFPSLTSSIPDASEIPPPSAFVPLSDDDEELDGGASQVSAAGRSKRKMSDDSLASEKSVNEMNHKELCKKYRVLCGRKHNPKYPYGGVPKAFSKTEDLRVELLRMIDSEVAAAPDNRNRFRDKFKETS